MVFLILLGAILPLNLALGPSLDPEVPRVVKDVLVYMIVISVHH